MKKHYAHLRLEPGYAETSTRKHPVEPETVVVGQYECSQAVCQGDAVIDGKVGWLRFKIPGERRYFFQYRPFSTEGRKE